jgi:hypothetical protein
VNGGIGLRHTWRRALIVELGVVLGGKTSLDHFDSVYGDIYQFLGSKRFGGKMEKEIRGIAGETRVQRQGQFE